MKPLGHAAHAIVGLLAAFVAGNFARRWFQPLTAPDITPGAWFCYYMGDYLTEHPAEQRVSAAPVELNDGTFIWATNTPEWDQGWFEDHGWEFPEKWVTYANLADLELEMKSL